MKNILSLLSLAKGLAPGIVLLWFTFLGLPKMALGLDAEPPASGDTYVTSPTNGKDATTGPSLATPISLTLPSDADNQAEVQIQIITANVTGNDELGIDAISIIVEALPSDQDLDGIPDDIDNCPVPNPDQTDSDADGVGDACDVCPFAGGNDSDGDGVCDDVDTCISNDQTDSDADGVGDACDVCPLAAGNDSDGDNFCDNDDFAPTDPTKFPGANCDVSECQAGVYDALGNCVYSFAVAGTPCNGGQGTCDGVGVCLPNNEVFSKVKTPANGAVNQKVNLNITANLVPNTTLYTIQLSEVSDFSVVAFEVTEPTNILIFSGLKYNTTYYNRVKMNLSGGWGETSSFATRTAESISYVTTPSSGSTDKKTNLNITANLVPSATEYTIQLSESSDFSTIDFEKTGPTRTLAFTGLKYNTTYYSRVRTNLSASTNTCAQACEAAYQTCLSGAGGDPDITGACGNERTACVAACPPDSEEEWGATRSFTTVKASDISYVVTPKHGAIDQRTVLNITANLVPNATEYTIQLSESPDFTTIDFEKTGPIRVLAFTGLKYNTTYYSRVRTNLSASNTCAQACEAAYQTCLSTSGGDPDITDVCANQKTSCVAACPPGGEEWGATRSFTTVKASDISYVVTPKQGAIDQRTVLNITANLVPSATEYTIQLSESPDFTTIDFEKTGPTRTLAFTGLKYNTTYYNRVRTNLSSNTCLAACEATYQSCLAGAGGDPDVTAVCDAQKTACLAACPPGGDEWGATRSFTTINASAISYVITPKNGAVGQKVNLNITANLVPNATEYTIQLSESAAFSTVDFEMTGSTRVLAFTGLKYNTTYYNRARTNLSASNICQESCEAVFDPISCGGDPACEAEIVAFRAACLAECSPSGEGWGATRSFTTINASAISYVITPKNGAVGQKVNLNITANLVPNATEYTIQLSESAAFSTVDFEMTGPTRVLPFTGLNYNTTYYSRVRTNLSGSNTCAQTCESTYTGCFNGAGGDPDILAVCASEKAACLAACPPGGDEWGATRSFTTINASAISYVITPKNGAVGQKVNLNITANLVPNATEYTIQLSESAAFSTIDFEMTGPTRVLAFTGLKYSTPYYSRVRTNLFASNTCAQTCEVTYQICLAGAGGDAEILLACASEKAACMAACPPGGEEWGATRSFTTLMAPLLARESAPAGRVGTSGSVQTVDANQEETAKDFTVSVAPNPFRDKLSFIIHTDNLQKAQVGLLDLKGRVIHNSLQETNATIEIGEEMASGTYLLKVQTSQGFKVIRVLKIE